MQASIALDDNPARQYVLRLADTCLIHSQRLADSRQPWAQQLLPAEKAHDNRLSKRPLIPQRHHPGDTTVAPQDKEIFDAKISETPAQKILLVIGRREL